MISLGPLAAVEIAKALDKGIPMQRASRLAGFMRWRSSQRAGRRRRSSPEGVTPGWRTGRDGVYGGSLCVRLPAIFRLLCQLRSACGVQQGRPPGILPSPEMG